MVIFDGFIHRRRVASALGASVARKVPDVEVVDERQAFVWVKACLDAASMPGNCGLLSGRYNKPDRSKAVGNTPPYRCRWTAATGFIGVCAGVKACCARICVPVLHHPR